MDLSIIIVNWNTKKLLSQCLSSIYQHTKGIKFEVIVVDNNSTDGSQTLLNKKYPQVKLILNKTNEGFGKANNKGMKAAKGGFLFLLNSDAFLIENSFKKILEIAKDKNNIGTLAPQLLNHDKSIQQSVGFLPTISKVFFWMTFLDDLPFGYLLNPYHVDHDVFYHQEKEVGWATGAAFMVPKKIFKETKGFDENIFMYGEEVEWCWRIRKLGYKIFFTPQTKIIHIGQGSQGKIPKTAFIGEYKGLIYLYKKHKNAMSLQILKALLKIGALLRILIFSILGRRELAKNYVEVFKVA